jgi:hypothetical protein
MLMGNHKTYLRLVERRFKIIKNMKFNFKKLASVAATALMLSSTVAAAYPAPFVEAGVADAAVVYGANAALSDASAAIDLMNDLNSGVVSTGETTATGGDSILLSKSSDNLNVGNNVTVFTGSVDESDLKTLLADGTYVANDNDEFDYEQKIELFGSFPNLAHFRDSDYESAVGLTKKTPTLGFKINSNTKILAYTLEFTQDAESDIASGDMEDIEKSNIMLMGKPYYVSDLKNGTSTTTFGKMTLLDSAAKASLAEGESKTILVDGVNYEVSIAFVGSATQTKISVNGETTNTLNVGESFKLSDGSYVSIEDILYVIKDTGISQVEVSVGKGKLEITSGSDIKLNEDTVQGVKGYVYRGTGSGNTEKIDKIQINWTTDEEVFLSPELELVMPGFEAVKFTMGDLVRPTEEKVTIEKDSDTSIELTVPITDGPVSFNILYANASGDFIGIGKAADDRLATTNESTLDFQEKDANGNDYHSYFVASYNITQEAQSYLLRAKVSNDTTNSRIETTIDKMIDGSWTAVCEEKIAADTCDIGDVTLTIDYAAHTSGAGENVTLSAGTGVNFNTVYTKGGLRISLPFVPTIGAFAAQGNTSNDDTHGSIHFGDAFAGNSSAGHSPDTFYLFMDGEDKDENLDGGVQFNVTIDDNSDNNLQVSEVAHAGTGGATGLEMDDTSIYETYIVDDVAPRILHYTNPDEDYAEVYYPTTDSSETYAEVYLAEGSVSVSASGDEAKVVVVKDSEVSSVANKNLIVVGGSCINSVAATILGSSSPICGDAFSEATNVAAGQSLIKTVTSPLAADKVAMLVAGYGAEDTVDAVAVVKDGVDATVGTEQVYPMVSA